MNDKQRAFVREYLIDRNATKAATRAVYSEKTAYSQGQRLLKNVEVQKALKAGEEKHAEECAVTVRDVVKGLYDEATSKDEGSTQSARVTAWAHLGKHLGMFVEKQDVNMTGNITFETIYESKPEE